MRLRVPCPTCPCKTNHVKACFIRHVQEKYRCCLHYMSDESKKILHIHVKLEQHACLFAMCCYMQRHTWHKAGKEVRQSQCRGRREGEARRKRGSRGGGMESAKEGCEKEEVVGRGRESKVLQLSEPLMEGGERFAVHVVSLPLPMSNGGTEMLACCCLSVPLSGETEGGRDDGITGSACWMRRMREPRFRLLSRARARMFNIHDDRPRVRAPRAQISRVRARVLTPVTVCVRRR